MKKLLTITIILMSLSGYTAANEKEYYRDNEQETSVSIAYPSPICITSPPVSVMMTGSGNYLGGIFTSTSGLAINPINGLITPAFSTPGTYMVEYSVSPGPDNPGITTTFFVTISPAVVPVFIPIAPICYGGNVPALPSVSTNGIAGTWFPSTVNNTTTGTYTFMPNGAQCAVSTTLTIAISQTNAIIITENGSNTVYVDETTNNVVAPLILSCETEPGNYTYQWFEDGILILSATSGTYIVNTAAANGEARNFTAQATNIETGCSIVSTVFVVFQSSGVPLPSGESEQSVPSGSTLADLVVTGTNIQWYDAANKNNNVMALPLNTLLVNNTTYYATQTVNGNESIERLPVKVYLTLGIEENQPISLIYSPNPTKHILTITTKQALRIESFSIYNTLGQLVQFSSNPAYTIDVSNLESGSYFIKIRSDKGNATGKFVKE